MLVLSIACERPRNKLLFSDRPLCSVQMVIQLLACRTTIRSLLSDVWESGDSLDPTGSGDRMPTVWLTVRTTVSLCHGKFNSPLRNQVLRWVFVLVSEAQVCTKSLDYVR